MWRGTFAKFILTHMEAEPGRQLVRDGGNLAILASAALVEVSDSSKLTKQSVQRQISSLSANIRIRLALLFSP